MATAILEMPPTSCNKANTAGAELTLSTAASILTNKRFFMIIIVSYFGKMLSGVEFVAPATCYLMAIEYLSAHTSRPH